jgi:hypothetical protein
LIAIVLGACTRSQPPVAPGPPITADPPLALKSMTEECDAMVAALGTFRACPNLDEDNQQDLEAWIERATRDFAAGRKVTLAADAQQAIALACRRGTNSVIAATERCHAGPRPKTD